MLGRNPHWAKQYPTTVARHHLGNYHPHITLGQNKNTPGVRVTAHHTEDEPSKKIPADNSCTNTGRMCDPRRWMACSLLCCFGGCEVLSQRFLLLPICRSGVRRCFLLFPAVVGPSLCAAFRYCWCTLVLGFLGFSAVVCTAGLFSAAVVETHSLI